MRWNGIVGTAWVAIAALACMIEASNAEEPARSLPEITVTSSLVRTCQCATQSCRCGSLLLQETDSFQVYCPPKLSAAGKLPKICEALRRQLQETWLGETRDPWAPKCVIIVHPSVREYAAALGPGSEQSSGCASLTIEKGVIRARKIDLRGDADDWLTTALPHELTHVMIADRFSQRQLPRWADEGMAILSEPESKRLRRLRAFEQGASRNATYSASGLMSLSTYPDAVRRDAFYWQSASLVAYLVERDGPQRFLAFVDSALESGGETALREIYDIPSLAHLEARWKPRVTINELPSALLAQRAVRIAAAPESRD